MWEMFYKRFDFKPSTSPEDWPSIHVLDDQYVTFALSRTWDNIEDLNENCIKVFKGLVRKEEYIYALDWDRRLTLVALELSHSDIKIIDAAMKYGYTSPDSLPGISKTCMGLLPRKPGSMDSPSKPSHG